MYNVTFFVCARSFFLRYDVFFFFFHFQIYITYVAMSGQPLLCYEWFEPEAFDEVYYGYSNLGPDSFCYFHIVIFFFLI